ncbi:glycosyltransferase family 4 protein [Desulfobulbus elongatus]|uniref:glycosyltransferase family 4 protein n=1 Tax=Desulfobulbus elongatus TaxID=53332 RepID=UPI00054F7369|nr:glycosyltransferase family 1 protein [Desulfobulbus elongatus]
MSDAPLRIGINATALLSPRTGIGQYIYHLGRQLLESDEVEPHFFYANYWRRTLRSEAVPHFSAIKDYIMRFVPQPYVVFRFLMQMRFTAGLRHHPVELYHEPNYFAFKFPGPSVVTVHDASWVRHPETHPSERLAAISRYLQRSLDGASAILTDSEFVKNEIIELFGVPPEKIFPVLLGVSPDFYPRQPKECRDFFAEQELTFGNYVLSVSTLEPRKNISRLIDAYSLLPPELQRHFPLVLVGMRGWLTSGLEARMKPLVERGVVKPLGYVHDVAMPLIYSGAAAFVFPSLYEGFGLPVLEAMACGVPVISSSTSSLPEVVGDAGILVDPLDVEAMSASLHRILEDRVVAAELSGRGIQRAAGFSWERTAAETVGVYRRVLAT